MDWKKYTENHCHPSGPHHVEIVAYEHRDSGYDVFVFEPKGTVPELEKDRVDDEHIFVARVEDRDELERVAQEIDDRVGEAYEPRVYYRELGSRKVIGRIQSHLQKRGAQNIGVRLDDDGHWELIIRLKDFPLAGEVAESNV